MFCRQKRTGTDKTDKNELCYFDVKDRQKPVQIPQAYSGHARACTGKTEALIQLMWYLTRCSLSKHDMWHLARCSLSKHEMWYLARCFLLSKHDMCYMARSFLSKHEIWYLAR
jgi:hypothetical protein